MSDPQPQSLFDLRPDHTSAAGAEPAAPAGESDGSSAAAYLEGLNPQQREAVTHSGGPCLVLAGAGSGKTRVLTHRVAWLIAERDVDPERICALTFTNKAAAEMRGRVRRLVGRGGHQVWLSTFHSLGLRLLRGWADETAAGRAAELGLPAPAQGADDWLPPPGFAIYDRDASLTLWRRCQAALRISPRDYDPGRQMGRCSSAVSRLEDPASWDADNQSWERKVAGRVWKQYRAAMRAAGAVDFDDLLVLPLRLLSRHGELRRRTAARFDQLLVDEYQDTNRLQYRLIRTLLSDDAELLVVGDEDQSIYRWRGADLNNVLDFQKDFPGAKVVRLEQNYRSTQPILSAAGSLVANNRQRLGKSLWTDLDGGEAPTFVQCATDREEAEWVARKIGEINAEPDGPALNDFAVLYRTNAQSRQFEEAFIRRRIPHLVVGGQRFFARREVRDVLAYVQLLVRDDDLALRRAIATPSRGIGPKTLESLAAVAPDTTAAAALRLLAAQEDPLRAFAEAGFSPAAAERLAAFGRLLADLRAAAAASSVAELIRITVERSGIAGVLEREENTEERLANIGELVSAAHDVVGDDSDHDSRGDDVMASGATETTNDSKGLAELRRFLDRLALLADADTDRADKDGVRLMSVHAAKGLEFSVVFLTGMEEELFPHATSVADGDVEEERRLCYVGMTRARRRLLMSAARSRRINGRERWQEPSRFISEIDPRNIVVRDYLSPRAVGSKEYAPSSFSGLGGRTGQRQRSRRSHGRPGARRKKPTAAPVAFSGPTRPATETDLEEGATVVHPTFGPGRITSAVGSGDKLKLDIRFNKAGMKTVVAKFAKLQVPER
ncbi:MAG: UvrD-helicase domain-containing protein [Acidobacteriota bacterium]